MIVGGNISIVGKPNVGKSTLMNVLSKSQVFAENKLFATLDTTVRKVVVKNLPFLLSDTVGFIRKLPTQLIESFKSTLDEVEEADFFDVALGAAIGQKWVNKKGWTFELSIGFGRYLFVKDPEQLLGGPQIDSFRPTGTGRGGFSIGKRF